MAKPPSSWTSSPKVLNHISESTQGHEARTTSPTCSRTWT